MNSLPVCPFSSGWLQDSSPGTFSSGQACSCTCILDCSCSQRTRSDILQGITCRLHYMFIYVMLFIQRFDHMTVKQWSLLYSYSKIPLIPRGDVQCIFFIRFKCAHPWGRTFLSVSLVSRHEIMWFLLQLHLENPTKEKRRRFRAASNSSQQLNPQNHRQYLRWVKFQYIARIRDNPIKFVGSFVVSLTRDQLFCCSYWTL